MNLLEAIAVREQQVAEWRPLKELKDELEQLHAAAALIGAAVKPPPRAKAKPVRAEKPAHRVVAVKEARLSSRQTPGLPRTRPGDTTFARCGHERTKENQTSQGRCRTCAKASQARWAAKNSAKNGARGELPVPQKPAVVPAAAPATKAAPFAKAAAAWAGQCPMLDIETGKRCSLPLKHPMPHSASGRTFTTALNPLEFGGSVGKARELDQHALRGGTGT